MRNPMHNTLALTLPFVLSCLAGCQRDALPSPTDLAAAPIDLAAAPTDLAMMDAPALRDVAGPWPRRVTLSHRLGEPSESLRLADGTIVPAPADLDFNQGKVLSLRTPAGDGICEKGVFASLAAVPVDGGTCPASKTKGWTPLLYLSAASIHRPEESQVGGASMLVRDAGGGTLYRARMISDSYEVGLATATLEYEPVP